MKDFEINKEINNLKVEHENIINESNDLLKSNNLNDRFYNLNKRGSEIKWKLIPVLNDKLRELNNEFKKLEVNSFLISKSIKFKTQQKEMSVTSSSWERFKASNNKSINLMFKNR